MKFRPYVIHALIRKDAIRLVRNGPALMLLCLFVVFALLVASSGLTDGNSKSSEPTKKPQQLVSKGEKNWIIYDSNDDIEWIEYLKRHSPKSLGIRFVNASDLNAETYPAGISVIEISPPSVVKGQRRLRRQIHYRYPGTDPNVLWPVSRWFLASSLKYFSQTPAFAESVSPLAVPEGGSSRRKVLRATWEELSIADILNVPLIGTSLLTAIQFFSACGLLVSLTVQERSRGALRAVLLTPASFIEFVISKAIVHFGLAIGFSVLVVAALQPGALTSLLFWGTMVFQTGGYFSLGLLIASLTKSETAPNLLSFAYLLLIGTIHLLSMRFGLFQILAGLTIERYGLIFTITSLNAYNLTPSDSLRVMATPPFRMLILLSFSLLMVATITGARRMRT